MTSARSDDPRFLTQDTHELPGQRRAVLIPAPAVGVEWSVVVPGGRLWRLVGGQALLSTSAAAANRNAGITAFNSDGVFYLNGNTVNILAAAAVLAIYQQSSAVFTAQGWGNNAPVPMPAMWLAPGDTLQSFTLGLQAGDQYSKVVLNVEECYFDNKLLSDRHQAAAAKQLAAQRAAAGGPTGGR